MTGYTAQKLYFQFDKMNNRKLQKSQQFIPAPSNPEEEFEAIGLGNFFGDSVDENINWDKYFSIKKSSKSLSFNSSFGISDT